MGKDQEGGHIENEKTIQQVGWEGMSRAGRLPLDREIERKCLGGFVPESLQRWIKGSAGADKEWCTDLFLDHTIV